MLSNKPYTYSLIMSVQLKNLQGGGGDFPGGPIAKTLSSQCRGPRFNP